MSSVRWPMPSPVAGVSSGVMGVASTRSSTARNASPARCSAYHRTMLATSVFGTPALTL